MNERNTKTNTDDDDERLCQDDTTENDTIKGGCECEGTDTEILSWLYWGCLKDQGRYQRVPKAWHNWWDRSTTRRKSCPGKPLPALTPSLHTFRRQLW